MGAPRVIPRYYGTIVTLGMLVPAGVYHWVSLGLVCVLGWTFVYTYEHLYIVMALLDMDANFGYLLSAATHELILRYLIIHVASAGNFWSVYFT